MVGIGPAVFHRRYDITLLVSDRSIAIQWEEVEGDGRKYSGTSGKRPGFEKDLQLIIDTLRMIFHIIFEFLLGPAFR